MAAILLLGFDEDLQDALVTSMRVRRHQVFALDEAGDIVDELERQRNALELVIMDMSFPSENHRRALEEVERWRAEHENRPTLLCVSTIYRGPQFEIDIERKGARVIYVW